MDFGGLLLLREEIILILIGVRSGSLVAVSALVCLGLSLRFLIDYDFPVVYGFGFRYRKFLCVF